MFNLIKSFGHTFKFYRYAHNIEGIDMIRIEITTKGGASFSITKLADSFEDDFYKSFVENPTEIEIWGPRVWYTICVGETVRITSYNKHSYDCTTLEIK
jgi:hypothetical protein